MHSGTENKRWYKENIKSCTTRSIRGRPRKISMRGGPKKKNNYDIILCCTMTLSMRIVPRKIMTLYFTTTLSMRGCPRKMMSL
jgi:hypothetical protein